MKSAASLEIVDSSGQVERLIGLVRIYFLSY